MESINPPSLTDGTTFVIGGLGRWFPVGNFPFDDPTFLMLEFGMMVHEFQPE